MTIAARAANVTERNADGSFRIAAFNTQIQIDDSAATVANNDQPRVFGCNGSEDLWPKPRIALRRKFGIETAHRSHGIPLSLPS